MNTRPTKKFVFPAAMILMTCLCIEIVSAGSMRLTGRFPDTLRWKVPVINVGALDLTADGDSFVRRYKDVTDAYLVFDPTLGTRFRPGSWLYALEPDQNGFPRIADDRKLAVDPAGFVANQSNNAAVRDYRSLSEASDVLRVLVTGGSTTAGWGAADNEHTWPAILERILNERMPGVNPAFQRVVVINSGVFGYNAAQELKRFQEETFYLNPHLVVAFNGINENWNYRGNPVDYAVRGGQYRLTDPLNFGAAIDPPLFFPYTNSAIRVFRDKSRPAAEAVYGFRSKPYIELGAAELYLSKIRQFRSLCAGEGVPFIHCLQPIMGMAGKKRSPDENNRINFFESDVYPEPWEAYVQRGRGFYAQVREGIAADWQHDLSGLFDAIEETVYSDPRHYNNLGNRIVAEKIAELVIAAYASS